MLTAGGSATLRCAGKIDRDRDLHRLFADAIAVHEIFRPVCALWHTRQECTHHLLRIIQQFREPLR